MTLVHMKAACIAFFHISAFVFPLPFPFSRFDSYLTMSFPFPPIRSSPRGAACLSDGSSQASHPH